MATAVQQLSEEMELAPRMLKASRGLIHLATRDIRKSMGRSRWPSLAIDQQMSCDLIIKRALQKIERHPQDIELLIIEFLSDVPRGALAQVRGYKDDDQDREYNLLRWACMELVNRGFAAFIQCAPTPGKDGRYNLSLIVRR